MRLTIEVWKLLVIAFGNISRPVVNGRSVTVQRDTDTVEIWKNLNDLCGIAFVPGWSSDLGAQAVSTLYSVYKNPLQVHPWNTLANLASHYTTRKCLPMTWLLVRHLYLILFHSCVSSTSAFSPDLISSQDKCPLPSLPSQRQWRHLIVLHLLLFLFQIIRMQYQFLAVACLMAVARREGVSDTFLSRKWEWGLFSSHLDPPANGQAVIYLTGL